MTEQTPVPPAPEQVPVCPRHPDRESYVRCQRCGRPTCPECQRPAAVGIQCVDCVKEGARSMRQGRTVFGGARTDGRPLVTYAIIAICAVVFVLQYASPSFTGAIAFTPDIGAQEPWRFLTAAFAHSTGFLPHILFNMYALWFMGQYLEPMLGRARYTALYLLSAVGGSVMYLLLARPPSSVTVDPEAGMSWYTGAVGASGAVFGLFGAYVVLQRRLGMSASGMYVVIGINAVIGFVYPGIAWQAHLGGLLTGALCAAAIAYLGRPKGLATTGRPQLHWLGLAGVAVLLVVLTVAKYALA